MTREELIQQIESYIPYNEQEERDKELILSALKEREEIFTRKDTLAHMTASAWIINETHDKVLMCYHNIYRSYSWLGGHADGEIDLLKVALKEAKEESSLTSIAPVTEEIFSLESLTVNGHIKRGEYVSSHLHLNLTYLLQADEREVLHIKEDENSSLKWFTFEEALKASTEEWFVERIYPKLNEKVKRYFARR